MSDRMRSGGFLEALPALGVNLRKVDGLEARRRRGPIPHGDGECQFLP
jgi:hypothetical protein